jgi:sigma-B regulation protein RsbU (phosphoserine phosphatase)
MGLTRLVHQLVFEGSVIALRVLDSNMATVAYADRLDGDTLPEPAADELAGLRKLVREGRTETRLENSLLKITAPIGEEGGELKGGAILVTLPTDRVRAAIRGETRLAIAISAIVLSLGSLIAIFAARRVSRPIAELTEMTRRIAGGDLHQAIDIRSKNELGALAASFNEMTRRLNESIEHLKETTAAKERIQSELDIAHDMQMSMVPKVFPPFPERSEFDVYATLVPAREVGGDLYDFFFIDDEHLCFAVADVSGKGVPAALFMAATKALFRAIAGKGRTPGEVLALLNNEICRDNESCMFVTLFCGILDVRSGQLDYSNAGHNLPYRLRADGVEPLENIGRQALGIVEQTVYESGRITLAPGEALLVYSDGVTEAMDASQAFYSEQRLESFLAGHLDADPCRIAGNLVASVRSFAGKAPQSDDITVLALRYFGVADDMKEVLEIRLANRHSELDRFNEALSEFSARHGLSAKVTHDLLLALEEILTNVISYGFRDEREHEISVRLRAEPGEVSVEVEDDGHPFNPLEAPEADTTLPLEERQIGGLGIFLVRKLVSGVEYRRQGDRNLLAFRKRT